MVRYNFDAKPSFNLMDYKKQLVVGSAVLSILGVGYNVLKPSKIEQNNANMGQTAQIQTSPNSVQTAKSEGEESSYIKEMNKALSGFFGKYLLTETQGKINSGYEQRLSGLEKRMEFAEKVTGKEVVSTHGLDYNLDENIDLFELRDNNIAVVYLNDKEGKPYERVPLSAIELAKFVSRYKNEYHTVPSNDTAKALYQMGINAEIITCDNLNDYSNLIKLAEVSPKCEK